MNKQQTDVAILNSLRSQLEDVQNLTACLKSDLRQQKKLCVDLHNELKEKNNRISKLTASIEGLQEQVAHLNESNYLKRSNIGKKKMVTTERLWNQIEEEKVV